MKQTFTICDYKGFENQSVELRDLTVLAGSNSVGKSSILQALLLSRHTFDIFKAQRGDVVGTPIPVNGPFLLELGNTEEIIRRDKLVSPESEISFELSNEAVSILKIIFTGDASSTRSYELSVREARFAEERKFMLGDRFYYSAAERIGPRLKYEHLPLVFPHTGYRGERTMQILSDKNLDIDKRKSLKADQANLLFTQTYEWLEYIIPGASFKFAERIGRSGTIESTYGESLPTNVGFGISYVLPIIVNGLLAEPFTTMIVENPEAHLHPSGQSRIGEFLSKMASTNIQLIIETHSEHVINGIRIAALNNIINTNSVIINFLSRGSKGGPELEAITLAEDGDLTSYPVGFFDQEERDLARITRLRRGKIL